MAQCFGSQFLSSSIIPKSQTRLLAESFYRHNLLTQHLSKTVFAGCPDYALGPDESSLPSHSRLFWFPSYTPSSANNVNRIQGETSQQYPRGPSISTSLFKYGFTSWFRVSRWPVRYSRGWFSSLPSRAESQTLQGHQNHTSLHTYHQWDRKSHIFEQYNPRSNQNHQTS